MNAWQFLAALPLPMWGKRPPERSCPVITVADPAPRRKRGGKALEPTAHQNTIQARVIRKLMRDGWIDARTVLHMGTTDAHKMFTRLRRLGVLFEADNIIGHILVENHSGTGFFRRHKWTGKVPAGFEKPTEKRGSVRGGTR